jgi:hypothetical protein
MQCCTLFPLMENSVCTTICMLLLLHVVEQCSGIFRLTLSSTAGVINKTMNETRERSKVCNSIISMNSQLDICFACSSQVRLRRKRKLDNTLSDQTKNTSNKLVINKNISCSCSFFCRLISGTCIGLMCSSLLVLVSIFFCSDLFVSFSSTFKIFLLITNLFEVFFVLQPEHYWWYYICTRNIQNL